MLNLGRSSVLISAECIIIYILLEFKLSGKIELNKLQICYHISNVAYTLGRPFTKAQFKNINDAYIAYNFVLKDSLQKIYIFLLLHN